MELKLRPVQPQEDVLCYAILDGARAFQRAQGFVQWTDDYPDESTVPEDRANGIGYVLLADDAIAGYLAVDFGGEPAYEDIDGAWGQDTPYAVVHRMGFAPDYRGRGLADAAFRLVEELCESRGIRHVRVDTDFPNKRMQHILEKNGYVYRGIVVYSIGRRMAYDKVWE